MKRLAGLILALLTICGSVYSQDLKTVQGTGYGMNRDLAIEAAQRDAVEKTVGILIGAETVTNNFSLISDQILTKSMGYIRSYEVISVLDNPEGDVKAIIEAEVGAIVDEVARDRMAIELLLNWLQKPRVMVLIQEEGVDGKEGDIAETTIARHLLDLGFTVIDRNAIDWQRAKSYTDQQDMESLAGLVQNGQGIELIISGSAKASEGITPEVMKNAGMVTVQAVVTGRFYRVDTGQILGVQQTQDAEAHINRDSGGAKALQNASNQLADEILSEVLKTWALQKSNSVPVSIEINGLTFRAQNDFLTWIENLSMVKSVSDRGMQGGIYHCLAEIVGRSRDLAMYLDGYSYENTTWSVNTLTDNKIVLVPSE